MSGVSRFVKSGEWGLEILATFVALSILCVYWCLGFFFAALKAVIGRKKKRSLKVSSSERVKPLSNLVTENDLTKLLAELNEAGEAGSSWSFVLDKSSKNVSYSAKRRDPKDGGPTEYLSTTTFHDCTVSLLRDFYMDNEFRMEWDKTFVRHEQLSVCLQSGTEVGRTVKKFPLVTAREYVLAWRLWEGPDNTFYCVIKACNHPAAPRLQQFKRVEDYLSGWRIRAVPGSNSCEVKLFHKEDLGTSREMAKMAFSRGIWSYIAKMEQNLKAYRSKERQPASTTTPDAVSLCAKLNPEFDRNQTPVAPAAASRMNRKERDECNRSVSLITQSLFLLGWAVVLGHGSSSLGAKIAGAVFMNKAVRRRGTNRALGEQQQQRYVPKSFSIQHHHR